MNKDIAKEKIIETCKHLHLKGFLSAADGNISHLLDQNRVLMTPRARHKGRIGSADIAMVDEFSNPISGSPSTEAALHCAIYRTCLDARWIIHAHPPASIAWTLMYPHATTLDITILPEVYLGIGDVQIVPYILPGTVELADAVANAARMARVIVLARHGIVVWGETNEEVINGVERIEHAFEILLKAMACGLTLPALSEDHKTAIKAARMKSGPRCM